MSLNVTGFGKQDGSDFDGLPSAFLKNNEKTDAIFFRLPSIVQLTQSAAHHGFSGFIVAQA